jgi:tRNA uridine 5-carboxymethylaminomethyl modification enzyme
MGGVAKGQIVREIDALGGLAGIITDKTMIQFRMLNRKKGPAMWSPRAQSDRMRFAEAWRLALERIPNLHLWQEMVHSLVIEQGRVVGVRTGLGIEFRGKTVILTSGTFMNGLMHIGPKTFGGGRNGEAASYGITEQLNELGFESGRMKTGTPPRVDARSIDYSKLEVQPGDDPAGKFSYMDTPRLTQQRPCHIGYTNERVHAIIQASLAKNESPLFNGQIDSTGPRYCPSIEDKVVRFSDKSRHQLFVEPEGWDTIEVYLNGLSSSLPHEVQFQAMRACVGFENARMFRPGYAIEYDYFPPQQLKHSLETRLVPGLFFAGQINGTTGYEEAGAQGIMAGINAVRWVRDEEPIVLGRDEAYIGVLIDDLITKGTKEPYRMFTSRAEYRILLRQDNADLRLTALGRKIGLVQDDRWARFTQKQTEIAQMRKLTEALKLEPGEVNALLEEVGTTPLTERTTVARLLTRPDVDLHLLAKASPTLAQALTEVSEEAAEQVEIQTKYAGYIAREAEIANKLKRLENVPIPANYDFLRIQAISTEARNKLSAIQPTTLGQALRISGVTPSDIQVLMVLMNR